MKKKSLLIQMLAAFMAVLLAAPQVSLAQSGGADKSFERGELDQLLAPVALYPDSLLAQIFMASTYPLEVVEAARWIKEHQSLEGDALTAALEKEDWDPSVKSLVNFPQVLGMMNEKLDWTQKLGDAFLAQQKEVLDTVQKLRSKAAAEGNLKSNEKQKVVVEKDTQTIVIEPANPQVVYVPTYNPTVVYGAWAYPSYPPYYYYPPGYAAGAALFSFGVGVALGAAWGYAWGGCNWRGGDVDIDINRNININNQIDRNRYRNNVTVGQNGRGEWRHDPAHRKGVAYRDQGTAGRFDRGASRDAQSREAFRGRAEAGREALDRGGADPFRDRSGGRKPDTSVSRDRGSQEHGNRVASMDRTAFGGYEPGGQTRDFSSRGRESLSSARGWTRGTGGGHPGGGFGGHGGGRRR